MLLTKFQIDEKEGISLYFMRKAFLRNEFHFSGVHGAVNRSGSRAK